VTAGPGAHLRERIDAIRLRLDQLHEARRVVGGRLLPPAAGRLLDEQLECVELDIVRAESARE
jgi:hypothetical protein